MAARITGDAQSSDVFFLLMREFFDEKVQLQYSLIDRFYWILLDKIGQEYLSESALQAGRTWS